VNGDDRRVLRPRTRIGLHALRCLGTMSTVAEIEITPKLKPYEWHGVHFVGRSGVNVYGTCPFCQKPAAFHVNPSTGQFSCASSESRCGRKGNIVTFLEQFVEFCKDDTTDAHWQALSLWRGNLPMAIFKKAGMSFSSLTDSWMVPVRTERGTIQDVITVRWKSKKKKGMATAGCKSGLFGLEILAKANPHNTKHVYVCEGPWDAIALRWVLARAGEDDSVVVALPGVRTLKDEWVPYFKGHHIVFLCDHDSDGEIYTLKHGIKLKNVAKKLQYIVWPDSLPQGYDVRDFIVDQVIQPAGSSKAALKKLHTLVVDQHPRAGELTPEEPQYHQHIRPRTNPSFEDTLQVFRKWLRMSKDLEEALLTLFAVVLSNQITGDPLWLFLVGPPGSGKSELLVSMMRVAETGDVFFQSSVSAKQLISGWKDTRNGSDPSMIPRMLGKTTVFKDWTEMLSGNQQAMEETYSILRGAYDGHVFKPFGNGVTREYHGHFSLLAGVTNIIHGHSTVALGERFLKFQLSPMNMQSTKSVLDAALRGVAHEKAKNEALQEATLRFLDRDVPTLSIERTIPEKYWSRIIALAEIVSILRHVVTRDFHDDIKFHQSPEVGTRLVKQLGKLAMAVVYTLGQKQLDERSYGIVERVAFDTAIGFNLDIVQAAMELGGENFTVGELAHQSSLPEHTVRRRIDDMILTKVIFRDQRVATERGAPKWTYKLSKRIRKLWAEARVTGSHINSAIAGRAT
jgi:energy-coupling factor transporter ATP-binding protein EcfA2